MILSLFRKSRTTGDVPALYAAIVAQSRRPDFYTTIGVPDTMTGRFDMVCLHLSLVFRRLRRQDAETRAFSQKLFDFFFHDMDRTLRETGVGDLSVGKRVGKMGELFYGLLASLTKAMDAEDPEALADVLSRNLLDGATGAGLDSLTAYVLDSGRKLDAQDVAAIRAGQVEFGELK